ncbi:MAG: hypothetical protein ACHP6I_00850 [Rickettsiales bacterium]
MILYHHLKADISLVKFEGTTLEVNIAESAPNNLAAQLIAKLQEFTGYKWLVINSDAKGKATTYEQEKKSETNDLLKMRDHPMVRDVLNTFTGLEILDIKTIN